jgi:hypothetical protein
VVVSAGAALSPEPALEQAAAISRAVRARVVRIAFSGMGWCTDYVEDSINGSTV